MKLKRTLALIGAVLLLGLYLATFVLAILDKSATMGMFKASVACTILIPVMLYAYTLVYKWTKNRNKENDQ